MSIASYPTFQHLLKLIGEGDSRNAESAFTMFGYAQHRQDPTVVSISKEFKPGGDAHTMVAYRAEDLGNGKRRIYVYDPNRPWADPTKRSWYTSGMNFISLSGKAWSFPMIKGETWHGDPAAGTGGHIFITPISIPGPHARSPASLGLGIAQEIVTTIFLSGAGAQVAQITDQRGRSLYKPGTFQPNDDPDTSLSDVLGWIPSDSDGRVEPQGSVFFRLAGRGALSVQVRGTEGGYTLQAFGRSSQVIVKATGGRGIDVLTLSLTPSGATQLTIENGRGSEDYLAEFRQSVPGQRVRVVRLTRLQIPAAGSADVIAGGADGAATVFSSQTPLSYDVEFHSLSRKESQVLRREGVRQEAGISRSIGPANWADLRGRSVLETVSTGRLRVR